MSAFIVDKDHIDALIRAGLSGPEASSKLRWYVEQSTTGMRELTDLTADSVGAMLWRENVRSVSYRYKGSDDERGLPGPIPPPDPEGYHYEFKTQPGIFMIRPGMPQAPLEPAPPIAILKAIDCYEYQTCEHPEWNGSEAKIFCEALRSRMICKLPGYEKAHWGAPATK